jgi:MFS family permease
VRHPGRFAVATIVGIGLGLIGAGLAPSLLAAAACLALSGLGVSTTAVTVLTLVQTRAPAEVRGRVMALFTLGMTGLTPLSYALAGLIGDAVGPRGVLLLGGACVLASAAIGLSCRSMRSAEQEAGG